MLPLGTAGAQRASERLRRNAVATAVQAVERHGSGPEADAWLVQRLQGDANTLRLGRAALRRYRYDRTGAAREFRALQAATVAPAIRLHAALGLAELAATAFDGNAIALAAAAASTAIAAGNKTAQAEALWLQARMESRTGSLDSALALFRSAAAVAPTNALAVRAGVLCAHGHALRTTDLPRATALVNDGLAAAHRSPLRRRVGTCLLARAQVLSAAGYGVRALATADSAITILRTAHDPEAEAGAWQLKAYLHSDPLMQPGLARTSAQTASRLGTATGNRLAAGWAELVLAQVAMRLAQPDRSWAHAAAAERLLRPLGDRFGLATVALVRAEAAHADGRLAVADSLYRQMELLGQGSRVLPRLRLAAIARQQGRLASADSLLDLARDDIQRSRQVGYGTDRLYELALLRTAEGRWAEADTLLGRFEAFVTPFPDLSFAAASRRAVVAASDGRVEDALRHLDDAARQLDRRRARLADRTERATALRGQRIDFDAAFGLPSLVASLAKAGRFDAALQAADVHRARALTDRAAQRIAAAGQEGMELRIGASEDGAEARRRLAALPAKLPDDLLLLEFVVGGPREPSTLLAVGRHGTLALPLQLPPDLDARIRRFTASLSADQPATALGRELTGLILGPALPLLREPQIRRVVVVPDGALHRLPFDALVLPDGRRLFELAEVTQLPSARLLLRAPAVQVPSELPRVIAFGDPAIASSLRLARLPASRVEARRAAAADRRSMLFVGAEASEAALRALPSGSARVLHFATHALVSDAGDDATALHLAPGGGHDGRLTPDEIATLGLDVDLVVLSACGTAGGQIQPAEGLQGLVGPFMEAGARNVLATHWDVRDRELLPLMSRIYDRLSRGASIGEAVRDARLAALRAGAGPRQWAVLTLVGEGTAVPLSPASGRGF